MIINITSIILLMTLIIMQIYQNVHSKNVFNQLCNICAGGNSKQLHDKLDTCISLYENIAIGKEFIDISIRKEYWNHYISFSIYAGKNGVLVATYIYNTIAKDLNKYVRMSNEREANAILKCMFRVLNARTKNRHININKISKKRGTEVLGYEEVNND